MILRFPRFTRPQVLKAIGRDLLNLFFNSFADEFKGCGVGMPSADLDDNEYFGRLARVFNSPEALPQSLNEALFAIDELACPGGQEQLEIELARRGQEIEFAPGSSCADLAMQVWLADPKLLADVYNRQRMLRLSAFAHFGTNLPVSERPPLLILDEAALGGLVCRLDEWFARHQRGQDTTRIESYELNGEHWFLVRHGDSFSRTPRVEARRTEIIHFRPERDDVVVYSREQDELRINARTKGERDLYVRQFGQCLRGREDHFSRLWTYTLDPLRTHGPDALDPGGIDGIDRIVLREVEVAWDDYGREVITREADDIFQSGSPHFQSEDGIPEGGRLVRAAFDFYFKDHSRSRPLHIRLPNILKLGRHCDLRLVNQWLTQRGFRIAA